MFTGRPRKPALCSRSLRLSARDMVSAIHVDAPFAKRCWNIFDRNAVVELFGTDIGFRLGAYHKHNLPSHLDHGRAREATRPLWVCRIISEQRRWKFRL